MTKTLNIDMDHALIIQLPTVIKAHTESNGNRIVEVEASCEEVDLEGDLILQRALLNSADFFLKNGMIDIDHLGEIGERVGVKDPLSYIIGKPLDVYDLGDKRTGVRAEIMRSGDGTVDAENNRYDAFWKSLQSMPPVIWYSSIFAIPTEWDNCAQTVCSQGATRYVIKEMEWHSLAMTRRPINNKIKGAVKIVKSADYIELFKSRIDNVQPHEVDRLGQDMANPDVMLMNSGELSHPSVELPHSLQSLRSVFTTHITKDCPYAGPGMISRGCFKDHFQYCAGHSANTAEIYGHALMMSLIGDRDW